METYQRERGEKNLMPKMIRAKLLSGKNIVSAGILRNKTLAVKLRYIPNDVNKIIASVDFNYRLKHLDTQLN